MAQNHKCQICGAEFDDAAKLEDHRLSPPKLTGKHTFGNCIRNEKDLYRISLLQRNSVDKLAKPEHLRCSGFVLK